MKIKWLLAGNIIYAAGQWLVLVVLTRFYTSTELGLYFFALSLVAPIALVASLKLPNLIVTLDEKETKINSVVLGRQLISLTIIAISYIIYIAFFRQNTSLLIISSVIIYKILEQNDDISIAYFQKEYEFKKIFYLKTIRTFVYISCVLISCLYFETIDIALIVSTLAYSMFWFTRNKKFLYLYPIKLELNHLKTYFRNGIHLSLSSSISSLNSNSIKLYIGYALGSSSLAIYGVITYSLTAFSIIVSALAQYYLPYFVKSINSSERFKYYILKSQALVTFIGLLLILISYYFGDFILNIFYGKQYSEYGLFLVFVFIANLFKSSSALIGTAMTSIRVYNFQLKFTVLSLILTVIVIPLCIKKFGMFGAYYGMILISMIEWTLYIFYTKKVLIRKFDEII